MFCNSRVLGSRKKMRLERVTDWRKVLSRETTMHLKERFSLFP
jgi:hypothetical protein